MSGSGNLINPRATPLYGDNVQKRVLKKEKTEEVQSFQQIVSELQEQTVEEKVKLSSHAKERIKTRQIEMDEKRLESLGEVAREAKDKGARNTLAMFGKDAFILSVKDKTVVTAMKEEEMESRFFTNIDSVYIKK
ncbi:MAG TPA: TIGR02530 family flagellar biosynthesis protein [Thermotogota bacterium]|nr:TIGR02530 family flagellar biosynthesis protein [Thermotogota bacterium]HPJ90237.1 TIGR02530 family flagellar biosynthesis protein [Thermotogota bacterium]HPR97316.1 TIGR02530 family flagellar biosynthesis protein [Thermotogota bacterium]